MARTPPCNICESGYCDDCIFIQGGLPTHHCYNTKCSLNVETGCLVKFDDNCNAAHWYKDDTNSNTAHWYEYDGADKEAQA